MRLSGISAQPEISSIVRYKLLLVLLILSLPVSANIQPELVSFYLPFENSLRPKVAFGSGEVQSDASRYEPGRFGRSIRVKGDGDAIFIRGIGNFNPAVGALAFWYKPDLWKRSNDKRAPVSKILMDFPGFRIAWTPDDRLYFMTGSSTTAEGFRWDYSVAAGIDWKGGEWHHIALTWDRLSGKKELYLDGRLVSKRTTDIMSGNRPKARDKLTLGMQSAPGSYDELIVWSRPVSGGVISQLYRSGAELIHQLDSYSNSPAESILPVKVRMAVWRDADSVAEPGEEKAIEVELENTNRDSVDFDLSFELKDLFENILEVQTAKLSLRGYEKRSVVTEWKSNQLGVFKVSLSINNSWKRDVGGFAVWPSSANVFPEHSFFGAHIESNLIKLAERLGINWVRTHDTTQSTWWYRVEPKQGEFHWEGDRTLQEFTAAGINILGTVFTAPTWAQSIRNRPLTGKAPSVKSVLPRNEPLANYVRNLARHHKQRIRNWEIWNEPEVPEFWAGTPQEFAQLVQVAYASMKREDPESFVLVGGFTNANFDWHEAAARAGALKYADGVSFHIYDEPKEEIVRAVEHFRQLIMKYGRTADMPLWVTEAGTWDTSFYRGVDPVNFPTPELQPELNYLDGAVRSVQSAVMLMARGVEKQFYYLQKIPQPDDVFEGWQSVEINGAPRPKLMARRALAREIDGSRFHSEIDAKDGSAYLFDAGTHSVAVYWCDNGLAGWIDRPAGSETVDLMGNITETSGRIGITDIPKYLRIPLAANQSQKALMNNPLICRGS